MGSHWGSWGEGDGIVCFVDMLVVRGPGVGTAGLPRWLGVGCFLTSLWRRLETAMCLSGGRKRRVHACVSGMETLLDCFCIGWAFCT